MVRKEGLTRMTWCDALLGRRGNSMLEEIMGSRYAAVRTAEDEDLVLGIGVVLWTIVSPAWELKR
jgi:hypothetical protein